jgi:putative ABC transport system substrate-binding protein
MRLIGFAVALAMSLVLAPLAAKAQQAGKVYRVGILAAASASEMTTAFRQGLAELGYVEGQTLLVDEPRATPDTLAAAATELVGRRVDVIFVVSTLAARAALRVTQTVPIVFSGVADPVGAGLARTLARPGGPATGLTSINVELTAKRLEVLKEALPGLDRVGVLGWGLSLPEGDLQRSMVRETERAAKALRLPLRVAEWQQASDLDRLFSSLATDRMKAIMVQPHGRAFVERERIATLAARYRLATLGDSPQYAEGGLLMSYGANYADLARRAAGYVDRILKGAAPAGLPVEQPTKFELVINLKTAKALGLTIPQSVLGRADQVIE